MKYVVTKITQKEWAVLVEAENEKEAFLALSSEYDGTQYQETKTTEVSKITVEPLVEKTAEETIPA